MWGLVLILFLFITWQSSFAGFWLLIVLLPIYLWRFSLGWVPFTVLEVMILISAAVFSFKNLKIKNSIQFKNDFSSPIILLVFSSVISALMAPHPVAAWGIWKAYFLEPIIFFYLFVNLVNTKERLRRIIVAVGILLIYLGIHSFWQIGFFSMPAPWNNPADWRVTSFFSYPNALALLIAPLLGVYWVLYYFGFKILYNPRADVVFKWLVCIFGGGALFLSKSLGGLAAVGLVVVLSVIIRFLAMRGKLKIKPVVLVVGLVVTVFVAGLFYGQGYLWNELTLQSNSGQIRIALWTAAGRMLKEHPFLGMGIGGFPYFYNDYKLARHTEVLLYPHNIVLNFWVELGLGGVAAIGWIFIIFFRQACKMLKKFAITDSVAVFSLAVGSGVVVWLVQGMFDVPYFKNDLAVLFWILFGLWSQRFLCGSSKCARV